MKNMVSDGAQENNPSLLCDNGIEKVSLAR